MSIVHLFRMSSIESGNLTNKDGCIINLTPEDLKNHYFPETTGEQSNFSWLKDVLVNQDCAYH